MRDADSVCGGSEIFLHPFRRLAARDIIADPVRCRKIAGFVWRHELPRQLQAATSILVARSKLGALPITRCRWLSALILQADLTGGQGLALSVGRVRRFLLLVLVCRTRSPLFALIASSPPRAGADARSVTRNGRFGDLSSLRMTYSHGLARPLFSGVVASMVLHSSPVGYT